MRKNVALIIEVPDSDFCWDGNTTCEHLDNEGGHPTCVLGIAYGIEKDKQGRYVKPEKCKNLIRQVGR